jgi:predicted nucleic acid-binding protein
MIQQPIIDIENINSWPKDFLDLLRKNKDMVVNYHQRREEIELICQEDVMARMCPPINEHVAAYKQLAQQLENILGAVKFMVFHCTRLTEHEAQNIKNNGLMILTSELVHTRIEQAFEQGLLSLDEKEYLISSEQIAGNLNNKWGERTGMLWFCSTKSILLDGCGLHRLFRSWGGEAIYAGHEEDPKISDRLRQIGRPCIVRCSVPFSNTNHFCVNFSEYLISFFVSEEIEYPEPSHEFDVHIERNLAAHEIIEIISIEDTGFELLTDHKNWHNPIQ